MTPTATTPAGRAAGKSRGPSGGTVTAPGHRRNVRNPTSPRAPRRVSGPATGRGAVVPQPAAPQIRAPRRAPAPRHAAGRRPGGATLRARLVWFVRSLPDHRLLDRLIRGRVWIPLLGVMLVGIVAMQVEVLKLGASMGRAIERGTALQSTNELLRENIATLADDQRIERIAAARGMVMPGPAGVGFLSARSAEDVQRAIANIHAPSPTSFLALTTTNGAVATALTTSTAINLTANAAGSASAPGSSSVTSAAAGSAASTPSPQTTAPSSTMSSGAASMPTAASNLPSATGAAVATAPGATAATSIPAAPATGGAAMAGH